jgi:hypothetical protein
VGAGAAVNNRTRQYLDSLGTAPQYWWHAAATKTTAAAAAAANSAQFGAEAAEKQ